MLLDVLSLSHHAFQTEELLKEFISELPGISLRSSHIFNASGNVLQVPALFLWKSRERDPN